MSDTLREIIEGMEHTGPRWATGEQAGEHVNGCDKATCPKCRLESLLSEAECDLVKKWRIALSHEEDCGYDHGIDDARRECADELETWLAVNLPRIKAEAKGLAIKELYEQIGIRFTEREPYNGAWSEAMLIVREQYYKAKGRIAELSAQSKGAGQ